MYSNSSITTMVWFFGRGTSFACGVTWEEPAEWQKKCHEERIQNIDRALTQQMNNVPIGNNLYAQLLTILETNTKPNQKHLFITTNWDYLLQREINSRNYIILPEWLVDSWVFHLNGSIEKWGDSRYRTPIILPDNTERRGVERLEFQKAYNLIMWERFFIIVGLSFKYKVDEQFLEFLRPSEDELPFGEGKYLIINSCLEDLDRVSCLIEKNFPRANIFKIQLDFKSWVESGCEGLWRL